MSVGRDRYAERPPAEPLRGALACTWVRTTAPGPPRVHRIVPDACLDLIWTGERLIVAGPDTGPHLNHTAPGTLVGVRFVPGVAPAVLGLPASELRDERPLWTDVLSDADDLVDELAGTDIAEATAILQRAVLGRLRGYPSADIALLRAIRSGASVRALADRFGRTERTVHRQCLAAFGYGPKTLHRVLRFQRALGKARLGRSRFADIAADTGYADQAHLARDVRALAGVPLTELVGVTVG
ncbi:MAG TPA: helix-turn-helix domain-containing protein [Pseudonocardiaceae bacterium]|jgi:AraC-like DNA-binding protein|nr:helix-turn-helix domain-containing protein [Pseudonocardiaceae bacterium]